MRKTSEGRSYERKKTYVGLGPLYRTPRISAVICRQFASRSGGSFPYQFFTSIVKISLVFIVNIFQVYEVFYIFFALLF